jgi:putative glycosyltransferase
MYRSAEYMREFHRRAAAAAEAEHFERVEFVYVNDGSPDNSLGVALAIQSEDPRVRIVDLSRNFGHHFAIMAGLEHTRGNLVFLVDSDLEEPPEALSDLLQALRQENADLAYGFQRKRKGGLVERFGGSLAFWLINALSGDLRWPRNMLLSRVMTQRYVRQFVGHTERAIVFPALSASAGFRQVAIPLVKYSKGSTTYSFRKRFKLLLSFITEFSNRPLHYIAYLGAAITTLSILYVIYLAINYFARRTVPEGYTSLAVSIWFLGGLILFSIGIVALYLSVIFVEVKGRPRYIVRNLYDSQSASHGTQSKSASAETQGSQSFLGARNREQ